MRPPGCAKAGPVFVTITSATRMMAVETVLDGTGPSSFAKTVAWFVIAGVQVSGTSNCKLNVWLAREARPERSQVILLGPIEQGGVALTAWSSAGIGSSIWTSVAGRVPRFVTVSV